MHRGWRHTEKLSRFFDRGQVTISGGGCLIKSGNFPIATKTTVNLISGATLISCPPCTRYGGRVRIERPVNHIQSDLRDRTLVCKGGTSPNLWCFVTRTGQEASRARLVAFACADHQLLKEAGQHVLENLSLNQG
jgi:hypothetical protein